jgi:hypothetical protein
VLCEKSLARANSRYCSTGSTTRRFDPTTVHVEPLAVVTRCVAATSLTPDRHARNGVRHFPRLGQKARKTALDDWGWFGPEQDRPSQYPRTAWTNRRPPPKHPLLSPIGRGRVDVGAGRDSTEECLAASHPLMLDDSAVPTVRS